MAVERYRDIAKLWCAKEAGGVIYALLGVEVQSKVDLGMAVRCALYDLLGYCLQIARSKKSYRKRGSAVKDEDGKARIRLDSEEFLSGLSREDRLIPIVTLVLCLDEDGWDGPRSISEMLDLPDERVKPYTLDYEVNLISPPEMDGREFDKFKTELRIALKGLKHQKDDIDSFIIGLDEPIDRDTAVFLNATANLDYELEEEDGRVDMCTSMKKRDLRMRVSGAIVTHREYGIPDEEIVTKVAKSFDVTPEYVRAIMDEMEEGAA